MGKLKPYSTNYFDTWTLRDHVLWIWGFAIFIFEATGGSAPFGKGRKGTGIWRLGVLGSVPEGAARFGDFR